MTTTDETFISLDIAPQNGNTAYHFDLLVNPNFTYMYRIEITVANDINLKSSIGKIFPGTGKCVFCLLITSITG